MVNMRPEQALFFAIYIAGLSGARPMANEDLDGLESLGLSALSQYQGASSTTVPTRTSDSSAMATANSSIDVAGIEADVSKVLAAVSPYLHVTSLPQIPTFLGLPAPKVSECASKIVEAAEPSITAEPVLMDAAVAGALGVAGKYLSTTTQSGSTLVGFPASDLPKAASEIVSRLPAGVKSAASSMISAAPSDAKSIESLVAAAIPNQYQTAAVSAIQSEASRLPSGVQSVAQSLETRLPSGIQGDINSLLGGSSATATSSGSHGASITSMASGTPGPSGFASKRGLLSELENAISTKSPASTGSSATSKQPTPTPAKIGVDAAAVSSAVAAETSSLEAAQESQWSAGMASQTSAAQAAMATMDFDYTGF